MPCCTRERIAFLTRPWIQWLNIAPLPINTTKPKASYMFYNGGSKAWFDYPISSATVSQSPQLSGSLPVMASSPSNACLPFLFLLLGGAGVAVCNLMTVSLSWRVWHFGHPRPMTVWQGLSHFCYLTRDIAHTKSAPPAVCVQIPPTIQLPWQIHRCQSLMSLATGLQAAAFLFMSWGLVATLRRKCRSLSRPCSLLGGIALALGGSLVLGTVLWHCHLDGSPFSYPADFPLPDRPARQENGAAIILGAITALVQIHNGFFVCLRGWGRRPDREAYPEDEV
ncbi:uncharacterized protein LOC103170845 isoform X2 [Ornithorhynchus anatinus]|uniref:uncharacterized protein LOC103170845 isoform X2 n=2 Tax=Ornithorhynchus anatinus TaxID=9258 RepID=UPI0010A884AE|nr:uncharacterized protein LOC103170845 isoform X2 [Ornithorhynchus anatinus]